jgi:dihydropteroate synthase
MGILNVTPDSFSDGGRYSDLDRAVARAEEMVAEGAHIIDVGGESTRPGSAAVTPDEEVRRVLPVIEALAARLKVPISVDTYRAATARRALMAGANIINDVWGLQKDPEMAAAAAEFGAPVVVMHNQGEPKYISLMDEIIAFLRRSIELAVSAGLPEEQVVIDPGIGFGKTAQHNLEILERLSELRVLGRPILLGTSRKSTIGKVLDLPPDQRIEGTAATIALGIAFGADIVRVHDVREMSRVARMTDAIVRPGRGGFAGE